MHLLGAWARPRGSAVLWHLHDYAGRRPFTARLLRRYARSLRGGRRQLAGASPTMCARCAAMRCRCIRCGTRSISTASRRRATARSRCASSGFPAADGVLRVGLVATFARWKGHETFLESAGDAAGVAPCARLHRRRPGVRDRRAARSSIAELRELVRALGLEVRVGFTGFVQDSATAMRALDIVVHASTDPEPFGLVIAEAMACGKPVVVSRAGGASELTEPGVNALAFTPGDAAALARASRSSPRDAGLRQRLGAPGDRRRSSASTAGAWRAN